MVKKLIKLFVMLSLLFGAAFIYYTYNPASNKYFPSCPFYKLTGLFCAGCGSQRAVHHLLIGNFIAALKANMLAVLFVPLLGFYYVVQAFNYIKPQSAISLNIINKTWVIVTTAILFTAYWIVRNIPVEGGNLLAPH